MRTRSALSCLLALGVAACQSDGPTAPPGGFEVAPRFVVVSSPLDFTLRESIPLPSGVIRVAAVQDMDGDGILDVVLFNHSTLYLTILERDGSGFVPRYSAYSGDSYTQLRVGDVDGDGLPEIGAKSSFGGWLRVYEATGDNAYALTYQANIGWYPETVHIGDSDGDGLLEFLVARETFPSRVHRFEGTGNNTYTQLPDLLGDGGNVYLAGVSDLDGDGAPETVFSDDRYQHLIRSDVYVYEGGALVFVDHSAKLWTSVLGDFDGNGLGEIVGLDAQTQNLKILESTGVGNGFQVVFDAPPDGYAYWSALDPDGDGVSATWKALDGGSGSKNAFALAHRTGGTLTDVYNSGALLAAFPADIYNIVGSVDSNGDGGNELLVMQDQWVHVLELNANMTVSIDIKPGSDVNPINTGSKGKTPVAILSSESFDAPGEVDTASLTFGATGDEDSLVKCGAAGEDVNGDGLDDLVCHFTTQETGFQPGDTEGILKGTTLGGKHLEGRDVVRIVS